MVRHASRVCQWILSTTVVALAIGVVITGIFVGIYNSQNVKRISGVSPTSGEVSLIPGAGISTTANLAQSSITVDNDGVLTINALSPVAGNMVLTTSGAGLAAVSSGNTVTFSNTGVTSLIAGAGITASGATGAITVSNSGVLTVNGLSPAAGDIAIATTGAGLSAVSSGNTVTLSNTGVTSIAAGTGVSVNATTGAVTVTNEGVLTINGATPTAGDFVVAVGAGLEVATVGSTTTVTDTLSAQNLLDHDNALSPSVSYGISIGNDTAIPVNTWRTKDTAGWASPIVYSPGAVGDDGQGNVGGTRWEVPAAGSYQVSLTCEVTPANVPVNDDYLFHVAFNLGASDDDPTIAGYVPPGASGTLDMSVGTNGGAALTVPRKISLSSAFHAGCTGCPAALNSALSVHAYVEHQGVGGGDYSAVVYCDVQVLRLR